MDDKSERILADLKVQDVFGVNCYRYHVEPTTNYLNGESGAIVAAPLIHTYSPTTEAITSRLALQKSEQPIMMGGVAYKVKRFLTVQPLNGNFLKDEHGEYHPTVKPHYAIAPNNPGGSIYNAHCKTLLSVEDETFDNYQQPVHAHDGRVSPDIFRPILKDRILDSYGNQEDLFITSYVINEKDKEIIITEHCLLQEGHHSALLQELDKINAEKGRVRIDDLSTLNGRSIDPSLQRFNNPDLSVDLSRLRLMEPGKPIVSAPIALNPISSSSITQSDSTLTSARKALDSALNAASSNTSDINKKHIATNLKKQLSTIDLQDTKKAAEKISALLYKAERAMSHHTSWFVGRWFGLSTRAFDAAKENFDETRRVLSPLLLPNELISQYNITHDTVASKELRSSPTFTYKQQLQAIKAAPDEQNVNVSSAKKNP